VHELIVTPFLSNYLVLRPGSQGALSLPAPCYAELARKAASGQECPGWLADATRRRWLGQHPRMNNHHANPASARFCRACWKPITCEAISLRRYYPVQVLEVAVGVLPSASQPLLGQSPGPIPAHRLCSGSLARLAGTVQCAATARHGPRAAGPDRPGHTGQGAADLGPAAGQPAVSARPRRERARMRRGALIAGPDARSVRRDIGGHQA
jgi:hypothetical protein